MAEDSSSHVQDRPHAWFASHIRPAFVQPRRHARFDEAARQQLEMDGYCVIGGVLSKAECAHALELAWDFVEAASAAQVQEAVRADETRSASARASSMAHGVRREDASTWDNERWPRGVEGGILPYLGAGQSTCAWYVRARPAVRSVFAALWRTAQLLVSFDGLLLWRPGKEHRTEHGWFHLDQNPVHKPFFASVQALVNLLPTTPASGGNVLIRGSHHKFPAHFTSPASPAHAAFYKTRLLELQTEDWLEIDPRDDGVLTPGDAVSCLLRAGDMLLWDSRVVHCSCPGRDEGAGAGRAPEAGTEEAGTVTGVAGAAVDGDECDKDQDGDEGVAAAGRGLVRAAVLVCYAPASRATDDVLAQRREAVRRGLTLSHWPEALATLGAERPDHVAWQARCVAPFLRPDAQGEDAHASARSLARTHTLTMCLCRVWPNLHAEEAPGEKQGAACASGGPGQTGPCVKSLSEVLVSLQDMDADVAALVYGSCSAPGLL